MSVFDNNLEALQSEVARKHKLEATLKSLYSEREKFAAEVRELAVIRRKEERDVDALGRVSLSSIFAAIRGDKEERLSRERREAYAAALKYDAAVYQLERANADINDVLSKLEGLSGIEEKFNAAVATRIEEIKREGGRDAQRACALEEKIGYLYAQIREIDEAVSAGNAAVSQIASIENSLNSAEGWGTLDLFGGGLLSDLAKHSHLDTAQQKVEHLQYLLSRLRTELADISITADLQISVDGFLRFADYFFDGLFTDWAVLDRINSSQEQVANVKSQLYSIIGNLRNMKGNVELEITKLRTELDRLAVGK